MDGARRLVLAAMIILLVVGVSILVLMDGARRRDNYGGRFHFVAVSILVLMDGARRPRHGSLLTTCLPSFNPCFDGWGSPTQAYCFPAGKATSFNPCFDGWGSPTMVIDEAYASGKPVSILVLMDGARRLVDAVLHWRDTQIVSILVLMDGARRPCLPFSCMILAFSFQSLF